jgi:signal transduction histidine kinase
VQLIAGEPLPVLVVDDDSALIRTLADILRVHGYAPEVAATGRQGLELARLRTPALAIVDLRLPDMDGMEVVSRLHALSELTEVVVLTGNATVESAVAALREKSVDYLLKPVKVEQFLQVASVATERWQRRLAERGLEARAAQQAAVAGFGQRALEVDDLTTLFNEALSLVAATLDLSRCEVLERRSDGSVTLRAGWGWDQSDIGKVFPTAGSAADSASDISVVIPAPVNPYGVITAHDTRPRQFTRDAEHFLQAIAHILGSAIGRHKTEAAFRQAQRLEAVGRLAGGVAHDFNNMLTAITGYGEMIRMGLPDGDAMREDVEEILKAAQRAAGLTRQLLAFSRQQVLQPRHFCLNDVVNGMEGMLRRLISEDIELRISLDPDLAWTKADPGQFEQVIMNLCVNARDAMPEGGRLTIETANIDMDMTETGEHSVLGTEQHVMLAVSDTGIGMDAETKARIYEPFFTTKTPDKGTGLGLPTVYGIVKQSGGDILVYSEVGHGTTFKVFLPKATEVSGEAVLERPRRAIPGGTETVLLAEDEDAVRKLAQRVLERAGYNVLTAKDGADALRVAESHSDVIHLLVTDMVMPAMNGRQLAERLRAAQPDMRTLYLSGYTDSSVVRQGLLNGGEQFLQKPFTNDTLTRRVRDALDAGRD